MCCQNGSMFYCWFDGRIISEYGRRCKFTLLPECNPTFININNTIIASSLLLHASLPHHTRIHTHRFSLKYIWNILSPSSKAGGHLSESINVHTIVPNVKWRLLHVDNWPSVFWHEQTLCSTQTHTHYPVSISPPISTSTFWAHWQQNRSPHVGQRHNCFTHRDVINSELRLSGYSLSPLNKPRRVPSFLVLLSPPKSKCQRSVLWGDRHHAETLSHSFKANPC